MGINLERRRKFTVAIVALCMSFALGLVQVLDGGQWVTAIGLILALYGGAEAWEGAQHAKARATQSAS